MKQINLQTLQAVLSAMAEIYTKGSDTVTMSQCLLSLQQVIKDETEAMEEEAVEEE